MGVAEGSKSLFSNTKYAISSTTTQFNNFLIRCVPCPSLFICSYFGCLCFNTITWLVNISMDGCIYFWWTNSCQQCHIFKILIYMANMYWMNFYWYAFTCKFTLVLGVSKDAHPRCSSNVIMHNSFCLFKCLTKECYFPFCFQLELIILFFQILANKTGDISPYRQKLPGSWCPSKEHSHLFPFLYCLHPMVLLTS